jgi:tetratricopeptide (TPR) repeat protein
LTEKVPGIGIRIYFNNPLNRVDRLLVLFILLIDIGERFYRIGIADTYLTLGKYKEAIAQFEIAFTHNDNLLTSLNDVAWLQASQKDPEVFSPVSALRYAEQAAALLDRTPADKEKQAQVLDTLAVALAANGKFKEAVATATQAYELSIKQDKPAFADRIKRRIELYEQEKAYRE